MLRNIGSGLLALIVFTACVWAGDMISFRMYPPPAGMDLNDMASVKAHMNEVPVLAFVVMLVAHMIGALAGGWIVGRFSGSMTTALVIAGIMLLGGVSNLMMVPHPLWFWLDAFVYVPAAMLGFRLGRTPGGM